MPTTGPPSMPTTGPPPMPTTGPPPMPTTGPPPMPTSGPPSGGTKSRGFLFFLLFCFGRERGWCMFWGGVCFGVVYVLFGRWCMFLLLGGGGQNAMVLFLLRLKKFISRFSGKHWSPKIDNVSSIFTSKNCE